MQYNRQAFLAILEIPLFYPKQLLEFLIIKLIFQLNQSHPFLRGNKRIIAHNIFFQDRKLRIKWNVLNMLGPCHTGK